MDKINIKIEEIILNDQNFSNEITVVAIQLNSPFFNEIALCQDETGALIFNQDEKTRDNYQKKQDTLKKIFSELDDLNKKRFEKFNVILFPEYSILEESIDMIREYSNKNQFIVVGNYYDIKNRASRTFVIVPEGWAKHQIFTADKCSIADGDKNVLTTPTINKILKLKWKHQNAAEYSYMQILTCKDFLYLTSHSVISENRMIFDDQNPGIILVPMCSSEVDSFVAQAKSLIRNVDHDAPGKKSIVTVLCNNTDPAKRKDGIVGKTQIVSLKNDKYDKETILETGFVGLLIARINPCNSIFRLTPTNSRSPNAVLISITKMLLNRNYDLISNVSNAPSRIHSGVIINPYIFDKLGLKKTYSFIVLKDYGKFKKHLEKMPKQFFEQSVGIYGIWGYHDILIQSYEQFSDTSILKNLIQTRLWPLLDKEVFDGNKLLGIAVVKYHLKVHGIDIHEILPKKCERIFDSYSYGEIPLKTFIHGVVTGNDINFEALEYFKANNICIPADYDLSDRSDDERNDDKLEFLVLIEVQKTNSQIFDNTTEQLFERDVLPGFIADPRIRTIEALQSSGESLLNSNYLFHIVGTFEDLNNIVLQKIVDNHNTDISCKTQLILTHDKMLSNNFPILFEPSIPEAMEKELDDLILDYITILRKRNTLYYDVATIKRIDYDLGLILPRIFSIYYDLNRLYYPKDIERSKEEVLDFIFSISNIIEKTDKGTLNDDDLEDFQSKSSLFLNKLGQKVERCMKDISKNITKELRLSSNDFNEIMNEAALAKKQRFDKPIAYPKIEIGTLIIGINLLNSMLQEKNSIKNFEEVFINKSSIENAKEKCEQAKRMNEIFSRYYGKISKQDRNELTKYLNTFKNLRNLGSHDFDIDEIKNIDFKTIPKVILEVCKFCITTNQVLLQDSGKRN